MRSAIRFSLAALLALPGLGCAQQPPRVQDREPAANDSRDRRAARDARPVEAEAARKLESVTWNSVKHELTWVISTGGQGDGTLYQPNMSENYRISLDDATMSFQGETRRFSREEAANVHILMDLVAKYAADSTVWWDEGQGEPVNKGAPSPGKQVGPPEPADDDSVAILHAAARVPNQQALRAEIRRLEQKLAELKRLERDAAPVTLAQD
jgi:hypothetical protein